MADAGTIKALDRCQIQWFDHIVSGLATVFSPFVDEVIDMSALGITFADLTIAQSGVHTLVYITADGSANNSIEILYRDASTITQADFVF